MLTCCIQLNPHQDSGKELLFSSITYLVVTPQTVANSEDTREYLKGLCGARYKEISDSLVNLRTETEGP
jgi:hypothetical protein